eukprot:3398560-Prymnesium_polylepis.1
MSAVWEITGKAGAAAAVVRLQTGARVKAEPDALVTMSEHLELSAQLDGGLVGGMMRSVLGQESLFVQTVVARQRGDAVFAAPSVGDVELLRVTPAEPLLLQKGAFLASDDAVDVSTAVQGNVGNALFSGA